MCRIKIVVSGLRKPKKITCATCGFTSRTPLSFDHPFCLYRVGAKQVEGAETSDAADDRSPRACVDGEGAEAEGRLHGDEQVPE